MRKVQSNILVLVLLFSLPVSGQENDFQSWFSFSVNKKIVKKTTLSIKSALRLRENSSLYSKQFFDGRIKRKFNKKLSYAVGFRYINKWNIADNIEKQYRFYGDISYRSKLSKRFNYSTRSRWQKQENLYDDKITLRQKVNLSYNIRKTKLRPSFATELFFSLEDNLIDKMRYTCSLAYPLAKKLDFVLAYRVQQEFYVNNPKTLFIFEGKLAYDL